MSATPASWPSARIGNVARLRAIAAARPHLALCERTLDAPFERVWSIFGDLERGVPQFDHFVEWIRITRRDGERIALESNGPLGTVTRFEAIYRPGWCVMRSRLGEVGMAADALPDGRTRIAHVEGSRWLGALGRWYFAWRMERELDVLARLCAQAFAERGA